MDHEELPQLADAEQCDAQDTDFYQRAHQASQVARQRAIEEALKVHPVATDVLSKGIPLTFGFRWAENAQRSRSNLIKNNGEKSTGVIDIAVRHFEFAKWNASTFMAHLAELPESIANSQFFGDPCSDLVTPDGYIEHEGWAYTAFNSFGEKNKPTELLADMALEEYPSDESMLEALGLIWFFEAEKLHEAGNPRWRDTLFESSDAFSLANGLFMWDEGYKIGKEERSAEGVRELARKAANARHAESREIAERIKSWWLDNHHNFKSVDAAAEAVIKIEPVSFRTARKHVGDIAKKMRSARKE